VNSSSINDVRPGTWDANGEDTLLLARPLLGGAQVDRMTGCSFSGGTPAVTFTALDGVLNGQLPTRVRPVRVGDLIGVLYLDSNSTLRLEIQP
jgi:hypothetical protein